MGFIVKFAATRKNLLIITLLLTASPMLNAAFHTYEEIRLVANNASYNAEHTDSRLINPWGLTFNRKGNLIVADNDSSVLATSYKQDGSVLPFTIAGAFNPTGLETNHNCDDFLFGSSANKKPAQLLFATERGTIMAFSKEVDANNAVIVIGPRNAVYKGLALGRVKGNEHQFIFAADFLNAKIDVFDYQFNFIKSFTDTTLPAGYSPFNIKNINGLLYVAYALQTPGSPSDELAGPGNGFVEIFDTNGNLVKRLVSGNPIAPLSALNAPWGLALAPKDFGRLGGALLVGNFGDGVINAYNPKNGVFLGSLTNVLNQPIVIDGLWALEFWHDKECGLSKLFFTSGPNGEADGLVGAIIPHCSDVMTLK